MRLSRPGKESLIYCRVTTWVNDVGALVSKSGPSAQPLHAWECRKVYLEHFGLREPPFSLTPDPRYVFMSERHEEGLAHLLYGVGQAGGFVQLTGEIGCGKTTLCRCLLGQLPSGMDVALILNPRLTAPELLASICDDLGIPYPAGTRSIKVLVDALNQRLLETHAKGRRTVLIIDEAQNLDMHVLEQVRLLTNLETSTEKLLQVILIGQPELLAMSRRKKLNQLSQRITARYHLMPLSRPEAAAYVRHRLSVAGCSESLFTASAMRRIYRLSGGVPRLINVICDRALLGAYALGRRQVNARIIRRANRETQGIIPWHRRLRPAWTAGYAVFAALLIGSAIFFTMANQMARRNSASAAGGKAGAGAPAAIKPGQKMPGGSGSNSLQSASGSPAADAPAEAARPPAGAVSAAPRLAEIMANAALRGTSTSSFASLFEHLGLKVALASSEPGCPAARDQGFECLFRVGNWTKLRYYDLPAILEVTLPSGLPHRVTIVRLGDDTATLAIGGREYAFPLREVESVWDGSFILLWNLPFPPRELTLGTSGEDVRWVRQALDILDEKPQDSAVSDQYDESLRQRVLAFQRDHSLPQDGLVGSATLVRLTLALLGSNAPSLSRRSL
jgi:general secretion pathway protein A